jgi:release factor glutamine methyltransferase
MRQGLRRRAQDEPLEYILKRVEFYGCSIEVCPDVLIPRPETEILVDMIAKELKGAKGSLWDLCTGSGCIGLALKKACPQLSVTLSDLCPKALAVARANAAGNRLDVGWLQGDLLAPFAGRKASFVVCNPPYVSDAEMQTLPQSVKGFEPRLALAGGPDGVLFYERLAEELPPYLERGAKLFFEIGKSQGKRLLEIFGSQPWMNGRVLTDWAGHPRFFFLEIE